MRRRRALLPFLLLTLLATSLPGAAVRPVAAAEFTLESAATYDVRPPEGIIAVAVDISFTNTAPDTDTEFSVFPEILLAVHDTASDVTATDGEGKLEVEVGVNAEGVNVATITLREGVRFEETVELEVAYTLADGDDPQLRVRPSVIVFPAWGFGTASEVNVTLPGGYEVRVDGDPLTDAGGRLTSGPIADPAQWLALVTATRPAEYTAFSATVPLAGGTADLQVRSFVDDTAWGERTLDLVQRALPMLEEAIGLPYPQVGALVLTESVATDASGFAESEAAGTEILVAFDQPPFTALHQVAHVWLSSELVESRWIREGMASDAAARVAARLEVEPPYDPATEAAAREAAAFPLDAWQASADPAAEAFGHAASWAFVSELRAEAGDDALRTVLGRVAASLGPYAAPEIDPPDADGTAPQAPLTTRALLDHLESVSGAQLAARFGERVLVPADVAMLEERAAARTAFGELVAVAAGWDSPDPARAAMTDWRFDDAIPMIADALGWLEARDALLDEMEAAGLSAPDRLQQAYRSFGGGVEAYDELEAQRAVVRAYGATAAEINAEHSFLERIGLIGGPDPAQRLQMANGRFTGGDLRGAVEAISEAQRILASAETGGLIRLASAILVVVILTAIAALLVRRRASYTAAP
ncbi:MAG: hypothetical protein H0U86_01655 [Chloroflexi bacterium]|nr:hypothetical protein [Chloroflexota bacterium]